MWLGRQCERHREPSFVRTDNRPSCVAQKHHFDFFRLDGKTHQPTDRPTTAQEQTVSTSSPSETTHQQTGKTPRLTDTGSARDSTTQQQGLPMPGTGGMEANTTRRADNRTATTLVKKTLYRGSPPSHRTTLLPSSSPSTRVRHDGPSASQPSKPSFRGPLQNQASADLFKTKHRSSQTPAATCFYSVSVVVDRETPKTENNRNKYKNLSIIRKT